jgi:ParB family chromosome partitioning protein
MSQRRSALGRGLGALISTPAKRTDPAPAPAIHESGDTGPDQGTLKRAEEGRLELDPNPDQPRREFDRAGLEQLARSIDQHGVLQPVVVRRAGTRFELVMGERRFRASQLAGRKTLPAVVQDVAPAARLELAIVENVQRQDLNPMELAHAYQALVAAGHTQEGVGRKVGLDRSSVANHIRLLDLSRATQGDVEAGRLTLGHAKALLQVSDLEARESLRQSILRDTLSVRAAEAAARAISGRGEAAARTSKPAKAQTRSVDPDTRAFLERIERRLQTKVSLHPNADGGGRIEIHYFNLEDLERIGGWLLGDAR